MKNVLHSLCMGSIWVGRINNINRREDGEHPITLMETVMGGLITVFICAID